MWCIVEQLRGGVQYATRSSCACVLIILDSTVSAASVFLLPLDFVPFLGLLVSSAIRSLSMGRTLHAPLFAAKRMTPHQVELWITERQFQVSRVRFLGLIDWWDCSSL